jgi:ferredoxin
VPERRTMLSALREKGVHVMYDCLRGECGLCAVDVLEAEGQIDHRDVFLSEEERAEGRKICTCVSRVVGGGVKIDTGYRHHGVEPGRETQLYDAFSP